MMRLILLVVIVFLVCSDPEISAQGFIETSIAQELPTTNGYEGNGVSAVDFNDDGWDDITICTQGHSVLFFKNNEGNGFIQLDDPIGLNYSDIKMATWVDYDNDNDLDLFITILNGPFRLYERIGDWDFSEVTLAAGLDETSVQSYGHSWGDPDRDGDLDLYICNYNFFDGVITNFFYYNNGDGTFENRSDQVIAADSSNFSLQAVFVDYNLDGWDDIFVMNDRMNSVNNLYENNEGEWQKVSAGSGLDTNIYSMSNSWADFDRDGDLDVYVSNNPTGNLLETNNGDGTFTDLAESLGALIMDMSWSATWIDYDNDGWEDLHVCTEPFWGQLGFDRLLKNSSGIFTEASDDGFSLVNGEAHSSALGDFNNDGFPDLLVNHSHPKEAKIYMNEGIGGNYLKVNCTGVISNPRGIGCLLTLWTEDGQQMRVRHAGESYLGQHSETEIFGLGGATIIDSLHVRWPSGLVDHFYELEVNQTLEIIEGQSYSTSLNIADETIYFCEGDSVLLHLEDAEILWWSNGSTASELYVSEPGVFHATAVGPLGIPILSNSVSVNYAPDPIPVQIIEHVTCNGGADSQVTIFSDNGVSIFAFQINDEWYDAGINDLPAGLYPILYASEFGCEYPGELIIEEPEPISVTFNIEVPACYNDGIGSVEVTGSGGNGEYFKNWFDEEPEALTSGTYSLQVTDQFGCLLDTLVEIPELIPLEVELEQINITTDGNGSAWLEINSGTAPFNIQWSNGSSGEMIEDLSAGVYAVNVTDANECTWSGSIVITSVAERAETSFRMYPNPATDRLMIEGAEGLVEIFDNCGRQVQCNVTRIGHNLSVNIAALTPGIYHLRIGGSSQRFVKSAG